MKSNSRGEETNLGFHKVEAPVTNQALKTNNPRFLQVSGFLKGRTYFCALEFVIGNTTQATYSLEIFIVNSIPCIKFSIAIFFVSTQRKMHKYLLNP